MRVTLDEHGCMYVYLIEGVKVATTESLDMDRVFLDKTSAGQIVGIEILGVEMEGQIEATVVSRAMEKVREFLKDYESDDEDAFLAKYGQALLDMTTELPLSAVVDSWLSHELKEG